MRSLFPYGEDLQPRLKDEGSQAVVLNLLGGSYSFSGQPRRAEQLVTRQIEIRERQGVKKSVAIGLGNLAMQQVSVGELAAAERNLRRKIELSRENKDGFEEAVGHQNLGQLLAYRGAFDEAEEEFASGIRLHGDGLGGQWWQGTSWLYRAETSLLRNDVSQAIKSAQQARKLKEIEFPGVGKVERDIIRAEWVLGAALVALDPHPSPLPERARELNEAATHLTEALQRCRRIGMVDHEPDILLTWARWHQAKGNAQEAQAYAEEALAIADRCEYRLKQAEIHNFLALLALDAGNRELARREAEIAKERAWCDGPPHCYKPALDEAERILKDEV